MNIYIYIYIYIYMTSITELFNHTVTCTYKVTFDQIKSAGWECRNPIAMFSGDIRILQRKPFLSHSLLVLLEIVLMFPSNGVSSEPSIKILQ